jgi:hypothetical protein
MIALENSEIKKIDDMTIISSPVQIVDHDLR